MFNAVVIPISLVYKFLCFITDFLNLALNLILAALLQEGLLEPEIVRRFNLEIHKDC